MMQSMRNLAQSWVFKALMFILVVSFGAWGVGDIFRTDSLERTVATAGATKISVQELNAEFERTLARARQSFGPDLTAAAGKQLGLLDAALNGLIERAELDQSVKKLGIDVTNQAVIDRLASQPQLQKDGKFDPAILRDLLQQNGTNISTFYTQERQDIARHQVIDMFNNTPPLPAEVIATIYKARGQKRVFDVITLKNDSVTGIPAADDKSLHDFYDAHGADFTAAEHRSITIAYLSTETVAKETTISDEQLHKEFDAKPELFQHPEERNLLQVVLQNEDTAKKLVVAARANGKLAAAAKPMGYEAIPLKQTEEANLLPELKPIFALKENQISDPIKTPLGWHVMQIVDLLPAGKFTFDQIRDDLRDTMKRDQAADTVSKSVNELDDQLAAGHTLEDIADGMKLRLVKISDLLATGKTLDDKTPTELPAKDQVLRTAFTQNNNETSPIIDDKKGTYAVVRTDTVTPSAVKPYDEVKDAVLSAWKKDQQAKLAKSKADEIVAALRDGKPVNSFKDQAGIDIHNSRPISGLGENDPSLPQMIVGQLMKMAKGEVTSTALSDKQLILRLATVTAAPEIDSDAAKTEISTEIAGRQSHELSQQYLRYLRTIFPVSIKQDLFAQMHQASSGQ